MSIRATPPDAQVYDKESPRNRSPARAAPRAATTPTTRSSARSRAAASSPGTRLREVELSEWVGASRTPIREALGRLEGEGLIARDPSRGMIVAELDHGLVAELYVMREVLEGTAAGLAARHASDAEIDALRTLAQRDREMGDDPARLARINRLFHEAMFRCAHNRFLMRSVNSLRQSMVLLGRTTLADRGPAGDGARRARRDRRGHRAPRRRGGHGRRPRPHPRRLPRAAGPDAGGLT